MWYAHQPRFDPPTPFATASEYRTPPPPAPSLSALGTLLATGRGGRGFTPYLQQPMPENKLARL